MSAAGWTLADISAAFTAIGVILAAWQLRRSVKQARVDFEDDLNREYRELLQQIPPLAQFDGELSDDALDEAFPAIFRYFDLSNEQAFLRMSGRVSRTTWENWSVGIRGTMAKPAFARAWQRVTASTQGFSELRRLVDTDFREDPYYWQPVWRRLKRWLWQ